MQSKLLLQIIIFLQMSYVSYAIAEVQNSLEKSQFHQSKLRANTNAQKQRSELPITTIQTNLARRSFKSSIADKHINTTSPSVSEKNVTTRGINRLSLTKARMKSRGEMWKPMQTNQAQIALANMSLLDRIKARDAVKGNVTSLRASASPGCTPLPIRNRLHRQNQPTHC